MRPGQGAGAGIWSRVGPPLGANIGMWAMASQNTSNFNNVLGSSSRQNIMSHLVGKNPKWLQQNSAQRPQTKVKRLNQENGPKLSGLSTFNKNKVKAKKSYRTIEDKKCEDSISLEALHCHMCDLGDFGSISDYISHLEGADHSSLVEAYTSKFTSNVELFRAEARITSMRVIAKAPQNVKREIVYCQKCQCKVSGGLATHEKSPEHLQVLNYLGVRCCGTAFNSRIELEEHWLSLQHVHYRSKLLAKYKDQGFTLQNEEENMQNLSSKSAAEPHYDVATWPAFDPTVPVGLKYVDIGASNKCTVCCEYLEPRAVVIFNHCCSSKHYQSMIFYRSLKKMPQTPIFALKNKTVPQNNNPTKVKDEIIFNSKENRVPEKSEKTLEIPIKVSSIPAEAKSNDSNNAKDKSESNAISKVKTIIPPVGTTNAENEAEPEDDFGTVLDHSIILDESKNESLIEEKSDKNEDMKEEITETVKETKDNSNIVQEQGDNLTNVDKKEQENDSTEKQSSTSSSITSKLSVITEEECDECENGSGECKKHGDKIGSPKRNNSEDSKVELGTPKKIRRTEEPVVATPPRRNTRRRSVSEEPTISTPTRTSRRKSISEEPTVVTPARTSTRRRSITQL